MCGYWRFERSRGHELCDKNDAFLSSERRLPEIIEAHDVGVLKSL